ncbi:uncharacterized protein ELE39_001472 [Cryptosporidium sp. chipmunk genotype I]|uniref:uncharacterized protein n=1 Tax=Cryptosporidium sp. chipmunk genotype I TaxID=1280935 RepID=UPI00351A6869|nr:hypothetical protein ELE39_001472 [Cryptosporidium sp. chipmunk genotype I]
MNTLLRGKSQVMGIKPLFPVKPLLSISSSDYEQVWKEVKWDTKRVNSTLDLFSRFCKDDLDILPNNFTSFSSNNNSNNGGGVNHSQLMSNHRLMALLKSIAIVGTDNNDLNSMEFFTRNDLCVIMTGIPYIDKKNFLRLMCLLDRSTPHTTTSPAGISRLKLVFSYYDWGWKGYLDEFDWKRLRSDILNLTYYGKLYDTSNNQDFKSGLNKANKKSTMPETLEEGLKQLSQEISTRSLKSTNSGSRLLKNDGLHISINASSTNNMDINAGNSEYSYFDNNNHIYTGSISYSVQNNDLMIDFPLFIKLVEFRIIKGTSQILRVELPGRDQEEFIARSILMNGGSIFLDNYRNDNDNYSPDKSNKASIYDQTSPSAQNVKPKMNTTPKINLEYEELDNIEKNKQIITEQIQELDNELNSLKMSIKNSHLPSNSLGIDISNLNGDTTSKNIMESIFGPPPEDLHGIFCDKPNDQQDLAFSSVVVPSSSTPIRKSRSIRSNALPITPSVKNDLASEYSHNSNSFSAEKVFTNDFPNSINNTETVGPPILL